MIEIKVTATTILKRFKSKFISSSFYMYWNIKYLFNEDPLPKKEDKI